MARHLAYLIGEDWFFASHFLVRARAARDAGWRVSVITRIGPATDALRAEGFNVIGVDFVRARLNPIAEVRLLADIVRYYRALRPDLVHHVALKPILLGTLAARIAGVTSVVNAPVGQGFVFASETTKARLLRPFVRTAIHAAIGARGAIAVFENEEDRAAMIEAGAIAAPNAVLIPGAGVDLKRFHPHPPTEGTIKIVFGGRMLHDKGVREFIEAARMLRDRDVPAECILAGAPDPENPGSLSEPALRSAKPARWIGKVDDMPALLRSTSIACMPSYREGLPLFVLEAMASGLPVVATNVTGCREAVVDGETGLLVPPRDPPALADALAKLVADPALRAHLGEAGRSRAEALYGQTAICIATLAVYERAIKKGTRL